MSDSNCKWFHISFNPSEILANTDTTFINQFIRFSQSVNHPEELALYSLKINTNSGMVFFVSSPENIALKAKEITDRFNCKEVSKPNTHLLTLEFGKHK